jgi:hypothetical protein
MQHDLLKLLATSHTVPTLYFLILYFLISKHVIAQKIAVIAAIATSILNLKLYSVSQSVPYAFLSPRLAYHGATVIQPSNTRPSGDSPQLLFIQKMNLHQPQELLFASAPLKAPPPAHICISS